MSAEENKAIVDRFNVELNKGNLGYIDAYFAPGLHRTQPPFSGAHPRPRGVQGVPDNDGHGHA